MKKNLEIAGLLILGILALLVVRENSYVFTLMASVVGLTFMACENLPSRACEDCVTDELNKIVHIAFVQRGVSIGTTTMATDILTAELAGTAYIVRNVSGTYDGGKGSYGKGLGKQIQRLLSKKHTLTFIDFSYIVNGNFWTALESGAANYDLYFFTDTQGWEVQNAYLSLEATPKITDDNQTYIEADVTVTWAKITNPQNFTTLVDSLAYCQQLFNGNVISFSNYSGSTATIIPSATDQIDMTRNTTDLVAQLNTGFPIAAVSVLSGTIPIGVALSYNGDDITLSGGTTSPVGNYTVVIKAANATGVAGQKTVNFTIS